MSANDQMLIKNYKGKFYVFNVMAESWSKTNPLKLSEAIKSFKTFEMAFNWAIKYVHEWGFAPEYDPSTRLVKDGASVKIINVVYPHQKNWAEVGDCVCSCHKPMTNLDTKGWEQRIKSQIARIEQTGKSVDDRWTFVLETDDEERQWDYLDEFIIREFSSLLSLAKAQWIEEIGKMKMKLPKPNTALRIQLRYGRTYFNQAISKVLSYLKGGDILNS